MKSRIFIFLCFLLPGLKPVWAQQRNLDFFLERGLANSPLLRDLDNQVLSTRIDSALIRANYRPQVSLTSDNFYAPNINGYGYDPAITNGGNYSALINVNKTFAGRKNLRAQLAGISLAGDSIGNEKKISEQDLKRTITAQYIVAYGDEQQLQFYYQAHRLLTEEDSILKKLTQSNVYKQADYLTFLVTLQQQQLQTKQLEIQYHTDLANLNYLCGIIDTASCTLAYPPVQLNMPGDAGNSVFYKKYVLDSLSLANNLLLLGYNYRPRISAYANGGYNSSLAYQAYKNFGTGVGLNLSMPVYDGRQRKLREKKIVLEQSTLSGYRDFFSTQYNQQIAMLRQQLAGTESLISDINAQIKYSETLMSVNGKFLATGDVRIADFVIAVNNYLAAKNLLTQNNISRLQIINQINYWNR